MKGISSESESVPIERDIELVAETGVQYHVCHISAKESIEAVRRGKARGLRVTCEVTPHHIALTDMDITEDDGRFKMNPPLRGREDREAIWAGLQDGTIDCIATDHAPHSAEEKGRGLEKSAFGTVGSETAFAVCYTHLVRTGVLTLEKLAHLMSSAPAAIIGRRAEIAPGEAADIAVFDLTEQFTVDPDQFVSKGKSSPFTGSELYGTTVLTVCAGKIVYRRR
ncbi:MAG: amidohydrolase family protein [Clostridia bacterium]|nr:amidohydrolase family protein [Clostridia bacterium]